MSISVLIAFLTLVVWLYLLCARGGYWWSRCGEAVAMPQGAWPDICVIVPARNEADILPVTLPSLLANDYPGQLHVVLVDDRSEDATASVAKSIAQQNNVQERLTVLGSRALPTGWKGKVWAMQTGLEHISTLPQKPCYVLFTDADIAYESGALTQLVKRAQSGGYTLTSLMVKLRCKSLAERFLIPAFVYFFQMLYPFSWVNDAKRTMAAAAGGCMLVRYDSLIMAGGMHPIRSALIDDCALGRQMKRQGAIHLSLTQHVHSMRPYPYLSDIRSMVSRSAYDQLGYSPLNLAVSVLGMLLTYAAPVLLALLTSGMPQYLGLLAWLCMALSFVPSARLYARSPLMGLALPAITMMYMAFMCNSAIQYWRGRGGVWKGRVQATSMQST
jgi:hopene-associated glycosyltransferase HpnB